MTHERRLAAFACPTAVDGLGFHSAGTLADAASGASTAVPITMYTFGDSVLDCARCNAHGVHPTETRGEVSARSRPSWAVSCRRGFGSETRVGGAVMATPVFDHAPLRSAQRPRAAHFGQVMEWPFLAAGLAAAWGAAALVMWLVLPAPMRAAWVQEGARVESATVAFYGLALLALAGAGRAVGDGRTRAALAVAVCVLMARELDLHLRWTGLSVLKGSFYLGDAPAWQKFAAGATLLALSVPVAWLVMKHGPAMLRRLKLLQPPAVTIATWVVVLLVSKVLDRSVGLMLDAGLAVPATVQQLVQWIEETLELALPLLIALAFVQQRHLRQHRRGPNSPPDGIQERT